MEPERRIERAERMILMLARAGRRARSEWRERVNILISMFERNAEERTAESNALNEKINILINTQIETGEQINETSAQINETSAQIKGLATGQAELARSQQLTDQALRAFINSLRKGRNGESPD